MLARARRVARALEEAKKSERRFRDLTELSADWFWETDASNRITWISGGAPVATFFGGTPKLMTVKLVESHGHALSAEGVELTGYGLGASGWVNVPVDAPGLGHELLCDWIEESYRIVAPKRLVAALDAVS